MSPSTATDEEVKKAYRNLAKKYHPDNYHDDPLADLAQEKMKEINEAYEEIQKPAQARRLRQWLRSLRRQLWRLRRQQLRRQLWIPPSSASVWRIRPAGT